MKNGSFYVKLLLGNFCRKLGDFTSTSGHTVCIPNHDQKKYASRSLSRHRHVTASLAIQYCCVLLITYFASYATSPLCVGKGDSFVISQPKRSSIKTLKFTQLQLVWLRLCSKGSMFATRAKHCKCLRSKPFFHYW